MPAWHVATTALVAAACVLAFGALRAGKPEVGRKLAREVNLRHAQAREVAVASQKPTIPQALLFVAKENFLLQDNLGNLMAENLRHTIRLHGNAPTKLYTDADCLKLLKKQGRQQLVHGFMHETYGPFKSDICRAALLWQEGGYYLDNDITPQVNLFELAARKHVNFLSMTEMTNGGICNAVIAASARHPIIADQLERMTAYYVGIHGRIEPSANHSLLVEPYKLKRHTLVGPATLRDAIAASSAEMSRRGIGT